MYKSRARPPAPSPLSSLALAGTAYLPRTPKPWPWARGMPVSHLSGAMYMYTWMSAGGWSLELGVRNVEHVLARSYE